MNHVCLMLTVEDFLYNKNYEFKTKSNLGEATYNLSADRIYSIPAYQREIRWKAENVKILLDDLVSSDKFLGTILLNKVGDLDYEIIDGQQRISVFILILKAIDKKLSQTSPLCGFENKTYDKLFDVLDLDFDEEKILQSPNKDTYIKSDILEQRERFKIIWQEIQKYIKDMSPDNLKKLKDNLLFSEINIIFASNSNSKIYVDYYLDLNDKSVKLDNIDILKANLFKIDFQTMSAEWANVQKAIKELRTVGLENYSLPTFYFHYFACTVNEYIDYKLSTLKTDLKFEKVIEINGHTYESGTNILKAINNQQYFKDAIKQLKAVTAFLKNVYTGDGLSELRHKLKDSSCDEDTIDCIFSILSAIIHIDDEVPKMLVMKYFLDVLYKETIVRSDVDIIFYIYVYSILFTLTGGKKESVKLIRVVLARDWMDKLKKLTLKLWSDCKDRINYFKKITANGKVTNSSGKYLPKHIIAIKEFSRISTNVISFNQRNLKEFLTSSSNTAEHFFINKSHKVTFKYGSKSIETEKKLPKCLTKYISCPVNYLYVNSNINADMGNLSIKDKIDILNGKGRSAFASDMNYEYFKKIKKIFKKYGSSYPDLAHITNKYSKVCDFKVLQRKFSKNYGRIC